VFGGAGGLKRLRGAAAYDSISSLRSYCCHAPLILFLTRLYLDL
jgi:hypothetical protein